MEKRTKMYRGDQEAFFEWFYETYKRFVYKEASRYYENPSDIEDLTQEVWLSVGSQGKQLSTCTSAQHFSYLATVVRNKAISLLRKRHETLPLEYANNLSVDAFENLLTQIDRENAMVKFRKMWADVPAAERELLERKYFLQETDAEIAETMGIQKNSVRMALSRARKKALPFVKDMADYI